MRRLEKDIWISGSGGRVAVFGVCGLRVRLYAPFISTNPKPCGHFMRGASIEPLANAAELLMDIVFIALGAVIFAAFGVYAAYLRRI